MMEILCKMKDKKYRRKTNLLVFIYLIILFLTCLVNIQIKDIVFADNILSATILNSMPLDEIVEKERYNSCEYNIVTPTLDQGSTNICWAYATASVSETSILKDQLDNSAKDTLRFSPTQIAYRTYNRDSDPLNNTSGVYANDKWNVTGSPYNTFLMLSQWCAPVAGDVSAKADAYENNLYRLLDAEKMDSNYTGLYRVNEIKRAIAKYGAVTGSYYNAREVEYYNTRGETLDGISHAITIVGWDDTIPASKFKPKEASQNGGWIIKNSYNTLPYFYLSYDSSVGNVCGFKYAKKSEFDFNYFYDNVIEEPMRSENNSKCVANVFLAKKSDDEHSEYVKAVNVATYGNNLTCNVKVYTNLTNPNNPESGILSASGERLLDYSGYHTVMLNNLAKIDKDTYYSVVVSVSSQNGGSSYILYSLNSSVNTKYKSASGWNVANYASRIKAYTVLKKDESNSKIDISLAQYNDISSQLYSGQAICPQVQISLNSQTLILNKDYQVIYSNNKNVGTAEIVVNGIGNYKGSLKIEFQILPIEVPIKPNNKIVYSSSATTLKDISLPTGWQWENPDLFINNITTALAIYMGEDKNNYNNTTKLITLIKEGNNNPDVPKDNINDDKMILNKQNKILIIGGIVVVGIILIIIIIWFIKKTKRKRKVKINKDFFNN